MTGSAQVVVDVSRIVYLGSLDLWHIHGVSYCIIWALYDESSNLLKCGMGYISQKRVSLVPIC